MTGQLLIFLFDLPLPLLCGYLLVKTGRFSSKTFDPLITLTILLILPVLAMLSFWGVALEWRLLSLPILGLAMQLVPGAFAWIRAESKFTGPLDKGSYVLSNLLCNRGVLGGLAVFILFGEQAYAYAQLTIVLGMPVLLGIGFPAAHYYQNKHNGIAGQGVSIKKFLLDKRQVALIGLMIGLVLNMLGIERPEALSTIFSLLIHVVAWALLVPVGASIAFSEMKAHWKQVIDILPLRFILCPVLFYVLGMLVGLQGVVLYTVVVLSATPTAINAVVTSKLYNLNLHLATAAFVLTTVVYMALIFPLLLLLSTFLNGG